jgi:hypothetical protein
MEFFMTLAFHSIVIPTGATLSDKEREAEWRDLMFPAIFVKGHS